MGFVKIDRLHNLEEFSLDIDSLENDTPMILKKPNEVYYEIYREARRKAKIAKKAAVIAYLEAKNIKNTYMLDDIDENLNLGSFLQKEKMSDFFINYHILPMVSAIWSMPPENAKNMPIKFFLKFFQNHGLFKFKDRPQWYTVKNRSIEYVNKVIKKISGEHFKNYKINKVTKIGRAHV